MAMTSRLTSSLGRLQTCAAGKIIASCPAAISPRASSGSTLVCGGGRGVDGTQRGLSLAADGVSTLLLAEGGVEEQEGALGRRLGSDRRRSMCSTW